MHQRRILKIDGLGEILFDPSKKAKYLNITIKPFKGVRVAVPRAISLKTAEAFARSKADWIKKGRAKIGRIEKAYEAISQKGLEIDETAARKKICDRFEALATHNGFSYNRLSIKSLKSKWGSCSSQNNISLNLKLIHLPPELLDYIILHELVHTRIKNHRKPFWTELDRFVGDAKFLNLKLKEFSLYLL